MSRWVGIHNWVVATVYKGVIACGGAVDAQVGYTVGGDKPAPLGVIVAGLEIIQTGFGVVDTAPVAERVSIGVTLLPHIYFTIFHAHSQEKGWPAKQASPS